MPCPGEEDLKYRLTRVSIDCIDLYLVESGAALNIQVYFNGYFLDFFFVIKQMIVTNIEMEQVVPCRPW